MKSKRAKATDIPKNVKDTVWERDGGRCIICGSPNAMPNAHYIRRSHGGLGIEENIVTLCIKCHQAFDSGTENQQVEAEGTVRKYLKRQYKDWGPENLVYRKCDYGTQI